MYQESSFWILPSFSSISREKKMKKKVFSFPYHSKKKEKEVVVINKLTALLISQFSAPSVINLFFFASS